MNELQLRALADQLRTSSGSKTAEEAAYYLDLFAPLAPALKPLIAGLVRHKVEESRQPDRLSQRLQTQLDNATRMAQALADALAGMLAEAGPLAIAEAERTLGHHRDWKVGRD